MDEVQTERHACRLVRFMQGLMLVVPLLGAVPAPAGAQQTPAQTRQTVTGSLTVQGGAGLEGAMVALMDRAGGSLARVLTNASGNFELTVAQPGEYRLRADRIGHASTFSEFFVLGAGQARSIDLVARVEAVQLAGIDVEGDRRCRVRPEEGLAVTQVWEEAQKALAAAAWTQERGMYRYEMMELDRSLDRDGRRVLSEDRKYAGGYSRSPFVAVSEAQLADEGFAKLGLRESLYYAPDAEVLLSDVFLDNHCFRLESGEGEAAGLIGLAFQPTPDRRLPEIEGTLWIDPETAQLRWLDFIYTQLGLPTEISSDLIGGKVEFSPLANGTWIVNSWRIRMPRAETRTNSLNGRQQAYLDGYTEQGGDVVRVHGNTGLVMEGESGSRIVGAIFDSLRIGGLQGARVFIEGTPHEATTAFDGSFTIGGLEPGVYSVGFSHPYLDALSHRPAPFDVEVLADEAAQINFLAPPKRRLVEALCQGVERPNENSFTPGDGAHPADGVLVGQVTDEDGNPVAGATVRVLWREWKITYQPDGPSREDSVQEGRLGTTTTTNESGHYLACWIPPDVPLEVAALESMSDLDVGKQDTFWEPSDVLRARTELFRIPSETPFFIRDLTLATAKTGTISGILTTLEDGLPVSNVPVLLVELGRFEFTDETGRYTFAAVPVGMHTLRVEEEGGPAISDTVFVGAGETSEVALVLPGRFFQVEGVTAEGQSAEDLTRSRAGHPVTEITQSDMVDLRQRSVDLLQILRKKGGARLAIHPVSKGGMTADYCIESSRPGSSSIVSALGRQLESCRRLLIAVDGQILHSPISPWTAGSPPSGAVLREILSLEPENIEKVTILSPMQGRFEWGEAGRNGALLLVTRRGGGS